MHAYIIYNIFCLQNMTTRPRGKFLNFCPLLNFGVLLFPSCSLSATSCVKKLVAFCGVNFHQLTVPTALDGCLRLGAPVLLQGLGEIPFLLHLYIYIYI